MYYASLDLAKAFDSVSQHAFLDAARVRGLPGMYIHILRNLYHNCCSLFCWEGKSDHRRVPLRRCIKQGYPISPFMFDLVEDPLLRQLNEAGLGYEINSEETAAMAHADEIVFVSQTVEGLRQLMSLSEAFLRRYI